MRFLGGKLEKKKNGKDNGNRINRFALSATLRRYTPTRKTLVGDPIFGRAEAASGPGLRLGWSPALSQGKCNSEGMCAVEMTLLRVPKELQVLRLRRSQSARTTSLRMTLHLVGWEKSIGLREQVTQGAGREADFSAALLTMRLWSASVEMTVC